MKVPHQVPAPTSSSALRGKLTGRLLGWALALGALPAVAQHAPRRGRTMPEDTVRQVVELPAATIDSLAAEPQIEPVVDSARLAWLQTPTTLQELVGDRVSCFETEAPHQFNAAVMAYVRLFTERQRGYTQRVLEREQLYFPIFEKYLAQYHLPLELKYLSVVESALIPTAKSQVGAVGLWQFMPPTAGDLRLKRDEWVDERMHPEKATEAACKHLRYLYGVFHDWELVLAAYNWGAGNVQRVIRKTGKHNFWDLYPNMPAETRNYVPTFTAVMYAMTYAKEHDLHNPALRYQHYEPLDTLGLKGQPLDLRRLSRALGYTDSLALARFNPEVRHGSLPAGYRPYVLRFPATAREHLGEVDRATLLAYCQPVSELPQLMAALPPRLAGVEPWITPGQLASAGSHTNSEATTPHFRRINYTLHRGQTLATVAEKYDVSPAQLRKWNGLRKDQSLKPGRHLTVLVPLPASQASNAIVAAATPTLTTVAALRRISPADSAWQVLATANARYAREAQERAAHEAAMAQALARTQKQLTARAAAQRRLSIAQAAAAAKATAATRMGLPSEPSDSSDTSGATIVASTLPTRQSETTQESAQSLPPSEAPIPTSKRRRNARLIAEAAPQAAEITVIAEAQPEPRRSRRGEKAEAIVTADKLYTVRAGDNLSKLADEHSVTITQLKTWNNLHTKTVAPGQQLHLSAPADAVAAPVVAQALPPARHSKAEPERKKLETHTVERGDTLYNISRRFGVSVQELRRLNHLASDEVKLGQKLVVQAS
ncbi:MAG: LysM peptidoglycan-binding domain-containing protein [Janthinobacterium lividum]